MDGIRIDFYAHVYILDRWRKEQSRKPPPRGQIRVPK